MKHIETYILKAEMREDLMDCYREVAPHCFTQHGAWKKTVLHPAKRVYITTQRATVVVSDILAHRVDIKSFKPANRRKYEYILSEVMRLSQTPEYQGKPLTRIVDAVVTAPAPEFFLEQDYVRVIFGRIKHGRYDADGRFISYPKNPAKNHKPKRRYGTEHRTAHTDIQ